MRAVSEIDGGLIDVFVAEPLLDCRKDLRQVTVSGTDDGPAFGRRAGKLAQVDSLNERATAPRVGYLDPDFLTGQWHQLFL